MKIRNFSIFILTVLIFTSQLIPAAAPPHIVNAPIWSPGGIADLIAAYRNNNLQAMTLTDTDKKAAKAAFEGAKEALDKILTKASPTILDNKPLAVLLIQNDIMTQLLELTETPAQALANAIKSRKGVIDIRIGNLGLPAGPLQPPTPPPGLVKHPIKVRTPEGDKNFNITLPTTANDIFNAAITDASKGNTWGIKRGASNNTPVGGWKWLSGDTRFNTPGDVTLPGQTYQFIIDDALGEPIGKKKATDAPIEKSPWERKIDRIIEEEIPKLKGFKLNEDEPQIKPDKLRNEVLPKFNKIADMLVKITEKQRVNTNSAERDNILNEVWVALTGILGFYQTSGRGIEQGIRDLETRAAVLEKYAN